MELAGLAVGYGGVRVAGPLDARFESGAVHLLTGPNGCGKTTLLRTILGFVPALGGAVSGVTGRAVSYVPQLGALDSGFPLTCREVVATGLPLGTGRALRRRSTAAALAAVGIGDSARLPFSHLSGGQRQRLLVARALAADADIVTLDEPTVGVDADSVTALWQALRALAAAGRLVLVVTHDLFRGPEYADRQWVLDDAGLRERPARAG